MALLDCSRRDAAKWLLHKPPEREIREYILSHPGLNKKRAIKEIRRKRRLVARAKHRGDLREANFLAVV